MRSAYARWVPPGLRFAGTPRAGKTPFPDFPGLQPGVWNHLQTVLFDFSATLPMDGPPGSVLAGMFGYQDAPTVSTLGAYLIYLMVALLMFFLPAAAPAQTPSSVSSQ